MRLDFNSARRISQNDGGHILTICYSTFRNEPQIEWFINSLSRECAGDRTGIKIVVVDFKLEPNVVGTVSVHPLGELFYTGPKPTVWQGKHRLTKENWFSAANTRNTALCFAPDGWIAYVDDLSVLMPGWLSRVRAAMAGNYIACGAYRKVKELEVDADGKVVHYADHPTGHDHRLTAATGDCEPCGGSWFFGCSVVVPVESLLAIDGWPEALCDGHGFEDCLTGIVLENNKFPMRYDRKMMTFESEEGHHTGEFMGRSDYGQSPNDKSHKALEIARASKTFDNHFGPGGIRELRRRTLAGEPFPIRTEPAFEWFTKKPLSEL